MIFVFVMETDYVVCDVQTEDEDIVDHQNLEDLHTLTIFVFITETDYVVCDVRTEDEDIVDHLNLEADHELWGLF